MIPLCFLRIVTARNDQCVEELWEQTWKATTGLLWALVPQLSPPLVTSPDLLSHGSSEGLDGGAGGKCGGTRVEGQGGVRGELRKQTISVVAGHPPRKYHSQHQVQIQDPRFLSEGVTFGSFGLKTKITSLRVTIDFEVLKTKVQLEEPLPPKNPRCCVSGKHRV